MNLLRMCWKCMGKGHLIEEGPHYTRHELRTRPELVGTYADILLNGGWAAPAIKVECPKCNGTGRRK
jgi:hypothetical protein